MDFNFQRATSTDKLEKGLGRGVTDGEIENAKNNPFSVDYVFCDSCESIFTPIENDFIKNILPKFRSSDLSKSTRISLKELKTVRLFFYLQIWRTSACDDTFKLSPKTKNNLRNIILNHQTIDEKDILNYPLSITYLESLGEPIVFTENHVGYTNDKQPNLIFMNDFVIQFFEKKQDVQLFDFYGLNDKTNYLEFINCQEKEFVVKVIHDNERKVLLSEIMRHEKAESSVKFFIEKFAILWEKIFKSVPSKEIISEYSVVLTNGDESNIHRYSKNYSGFFIPKSKEKGC